MTSTQTGDKGLRELRVLLPVPEEVMFVVWFALAPWLPYPLFTGRR